jgi:hypothetical protein
MSEITLSPNAIQMMKEAGWTFYEPRQWFERRYYNCPNAGWIARDISDYTGYDVSDCDMSSSEGYWYVSLATDDECYDFSMKYNEYYDMRQRVNHALFNNVLVVTKEQYSKIIEAVRDYDKRFVAGHVMIAIPEDATTKSIIAILDALEM